MLKLTAYQLEFILNKTNEIVVSKLSNSTITPTGANGEEVAEFYQAIYDKIYNIVTTADIG